jgi:hypothetical protein
MEDCIQCGLDGAKHDSQTLAKVAASTFGAGVDAGGITVVAGTEERQSSSHTAVLQFGATAGTRIFVKKVTNAMLATKGWPDRYRALKYILVECNFYKEFAPTLASRGVRLPKVALVEENLSALEKEGAATLEPSELELDRCGGILWLQAADPQTLFQDSPLAAHDVGKALRGIARLHAAAFEDTPLLLQASSLLQKHGGSFALSARNPKELEALQNNWEQFMLHFHHLDPALFARESVARLGERLYTQSAHIATELAPQPNSKYATLVHGGKSKRDMSFGIPMVRVRSERGHGDEVLSTTFKNENNRSHHHPKKNANAAIITAIAVSSNVNYN